MAEAIAFNIVADLITKLGVASFREIRSVLKNDLNKLEEKLSTIKAVLVDADRRQVVDADRRQEESKAIQLWIRRLNEVVYDADDLLDAFHTKNLQRENGRTKMKEVREFFSSSNQLAFRYNLGYKIKKIRERIDEIVADMSEFKFVVTERVIYRARIAAKDRESDSLVDSIVIGREEEKEDIVKMLMCSSSEEKVSIIPIVGFGGLGKTTLTQLVYCDERVVKHFECMIWVCVSEDFERKSLVKRILQSITKKEVGDLDIDPLQRQLQEHIDGKRYLLVLDDIWNDDREKWLGVKKFLVGGAQGSKIMVTTRSKIVSSVMGVKDPYMLAGLTEEQSWNLFVAFLGRKEVHPNIKAIGEQIVAKCKGVPLAIRILGSVMESKANENEWLAIQNGEVWSLCEIANNIFPILKLSYDHLPAHLRQCFAFCSLFPKDHVFEKDLLVRLWIAQGYIQSSGGSLLLEEIGDQYFEDLISRSFFQDVQRADDSNEILSCKMHDLIHDLALRVGGTHCRFIAENDVAVNISERLSHVLFEDPSEDVLRQLLQARGLRTYLSIHSYSFYSKKYRANMFLLSKCKRMRALDLSRCDFKELPNWVCKMQHLRYLDLSHNYKIEVIPNSITNLVNLQMLNLSSCSNLKELPEGIGKLISLRHLVIEDCFEISHMPRGLEKLTSLRTLSKFIVGGDKRRSVGVGALKDLNNLVGSLSIENLEKVRDARLESKAANLMGKQYLKKLSLNWKRFGRAVVKDIDEGGEILLEGLQPHPNLKMLQIEEYGGARFPSWMMGNMGKSLPNIVSISLSNCPNIKQLPPFHQLPCLKSLSLVCLPKVEYGGDGDGSSSSSSPSFPSLTSLKILDCPMLTSMPLAPLLEILVLRSVSEKLVCQQLSSSPLSRLSYLTIETSGYLEKAVVKDIDNDAEILLKGQQPHKNLKKLEIKGYRGEGLPIWMMGNRGISFPNILLVSISLSNCPNIKQLPPFHRLPCLKKLYLYKLPKVVEYGGDGDGSSSSSPPSFPCLTSLEILYCPMLTSMPLAPLLEKLYLVSVSEKLVCQQLSSSPLSRLSSLSILGIEDIEALPEEDVLRNLTSLKALEIRRCPRLLRLAEIQHLTALEELSIDDCEQVDLSDDGINWQALRSLCDLQIGSFPKLVSLPEGLQHVTTLHRITIYDCPGLVALPEWMSNLTSLKALEIWNCPRLLRLAEIQHLTALEDLTIYDCKEVDLSDDGMNWQALRSLRTLTIGDFPKLVSLPEGLQHVTTLRSIKISKCRGLVALPEWMSNLTSLEDLDISRCPLLSERCQKDTGEDWPKIAHMPYIDIDGRTVQLIR